MNVFQQMKELLNTGECTVVFTKKDGTQRMMTCTRDLNRIPEESHPKGTGRKESTEALPVWDIRKKAWRSFRADSIKKVTQRITLKEAQND